MSEEYQRATVEDDEITLKELFLKIGEFVSEIRKNMWLVLILSLIAIFFFMFKAYTTPKVYVADTTFTLANSEKGDSKAGISGILGQFGFGGAGDQGLNIQRVITLAESREIAELILFEKAEVNDTTSLLANHILSLYNLREQWGKKNEELKVFSFVNISTDSFSRLENSVLKRLHTILTKPSNEDRLLKMDFEESSGIFTLTAQTESEELSLILVEKILEVLSNYYIKKTVEPQQKRYDEIKSRYDSITNALETLDYRVANYNDRSNSLINQSSRVQGLKLKRDQQLLTASYTEVKRNLEVADFALKSVTPIFQSLDEAIPPLSTIRESKVTALLTGAFLGGFLSILFIVGRKIYRDTMNS